MKGLGWGIHFLGSRLGSQGFIAQDVVLTGLWAYGVLAITIGICVPW